MPPLSQLITFFSRRRIIAVAAWLILIVIFLSLLDLNGYQTVRGALPSKLKAAPASASPQAPSQESTPPQPPPLQPPIPQPKPPTKLNDETPHLKPPELEDDSPQANPDDHTPQPSPPELKENTPQPAPPKQQDETLQLTPPGLEDNTTPANADDHTPQPIPPAVEDEVSVHNTTKPDNATFQWSNLPIHYPVTSLIPLPTGSPLPIPRIQHHFAEDNSTAEALRLERLSAVKESFQHAWKGYKEHAWLADEVGPLSGDRHNFFGGWAASLVDALDTLWIMDMKDEFAEAVKAIESIDFTTTEEATLNIFETTIRYMGGFLGAYDLSNGEYPLLLEKAKELGEMLLVAFDTPNRMPVTRWDWKKSRDGEQLEAGENVLAAEIGSLTLEFTRLTQLTGDGRYFDAVQRIMNEFDKQQMDTRLPGMWPVIVNAKDLDFRNDTGYTLGAMSDSLYEYLPKQHMLLGGRTTQYSRLYQRAADVFEDFNFYRPMTKDNADNLFSGLVRVEDNGASPVLDNSMQHLVCFAGGMVAIGSKIFDRPNELETARKLVDGCIWAYSSMENGLMVEVSHHIACESKLSCEWNETLWHNEIMARETDEERAAELTYESRLVRKIQNEHLIPGYTAINDRRYILRPEAIESVFMWYRISGDSAYQDKAWGMFESIQNATRTDIANAALDDVTTQPPKKADRMESFWMAETLKYFYLIFSGTEVVSLDEFVFNTEAHPFRRPKQ